MQFLSEIQVDGNSTEILLSIVDTCQYMHSSVTKASVDFLAVSHDMRE